MWVILANDNCGISRMLTKRIIFNYSLSIRSAITSQVKFIIQILQILLVLDNYQLSFLYEIQIIDSILHYLALED